MTTSPRTRHWQPRRSSGSASIEARKSRSSAPGGERFVPPLSTRTRQVPQVPVRQPNVYVCAAGVDDVDEQRVEGHFYVHVLEREVHQGEAFANVVCVHGVR